MTKKKNTRKKGMCKHCAFRQGSRGCMLKTCCVAWDAPRPHKCKVRRVGWCRDCPYKRKIPCTGWCIVKLMESRRRIRRTEYAAHGEGECHGKV